jgi:hypothetical protein
MRAKRQRDCQRLADAGAAAPRCRRPWFAKSCEVETNVLIRIGVTIRSLRFKSAGVKGFSSTSPFGWHRTAADRPLRAVFDQFQNRARTKVKIERRGQGAWCVALPQPTGSISSQSKAASSVWSEVVGTASGSRAARRLC